MEVDDLPSPAELWWPFAVLAAAEAARGGTSWTAHPAQQLLSYDGPEGWLCLQRLYRSRLVLWAAPTGEPPLDDLAETPAWVLSDAARQAYGDGITTLAWHAHGEWDGLTEEVSPGTAALLDRTADLPAPLAALVPLARRGDVSADELAEALDDPADPAAALEVLRAVGAEDGHAQGTVRDLLGEAIRKQMRATRDVDRILVQRPAVLVHWARVAEPPDDFSFAVCVDDGALVAAADNHHLPEQFEGALVNVLRELLNEEAGSEQGRWLFARVTFADALVGLERRYDGWPGWFSGPGPSLPSLAREMAARRPPYLPAWASLLPTSG